MHVPFIPGNLPAHPGPLGRFLPPTPRGAATRWLQAQKIPPGSWILDPFGAAPRLAVEAAQAGYRVLAAVNNPIARFLLELHAQPPSEAELRAALADLGASHKGDERLEPHIRGLYATHCAQCNQTVMAKAFVWEREAKAPSSRLYDCPHCGDREERIASQNDLRQAERFSASGLHQSRALARVAPLDDPDREHAEEALQAYLPRAVYALFTLVNKLESLPEQTRFLVRALLLSALDQANNLWTYPSGRERPRKLSAPPRFLEKNVWLALEDAVVAWSASLGSTATPLVPWPETPPQSGGITLFEGRLRDLVEAFQAGQAAEIETHAVIAAVPRPNQAYWTLSALWSGWLWGYEAAAPFKSVLRRRRYDWAWHATALYANLKHTARILAKDRPFFSLIGEAEPGLLSAAIVAADMAGYDLLGLALRPQEEQAQSTWQISKTSAGSKKITSGHAQIEEGLLNYVAERGEPVTYDHLHSAVLVEMAQQRMIARQSYSSPGEALAQTQDDIQARLTKLYEDGKLVRFTESTRSLESGQWGLTFGAGEHNLTLSDRVEMQVVRFLQRNPGSTFEEIDRRICTQFTGLFTPDRTLIRACLQSYAELDGPAGSGWRLRAEDSPASRRQDLKEMRQLLIRLGRQVGYRPQTGNETPGSSSPRTPIQWLDEAGNVVYDFYILASAVFSKIVNDRDTCADPLDSKIDKERKNLILVVPGGRAGLVDTKLQHNPQLCEIVDRRWQFLKYRHVRRMVEDPNLSQHNLDANFTQDPLSNSDPQMKLL